MNALLETHIDLPLFARGKVRDTYELSDDRLLMVATDRISAFDYVLPTGIPDRGRVLTQLSAFWFQRTAQLQENHLLQPGEDGRSMIVRRARRIDGSDHSERAAFGRGDSSVQDRIESVFHIGGRERPAVMKPHAAP